MLIRFITKTWLLKLTGDAREFAGFDSFVAVVSYKSPRKDMKTSVKKQSREDYGSLHPTLKNMPKQEKS